MKLVGCGGSLASSVPWDVFTQSVQHR